MKDNVKIAFHTLGCKLNFAESAQLAYQAKECGYQSVTSRAFDEPAHIYVINTCSVTENADKECAYLVRKVKRKSPDSIVIITGCYAQLKPTHISQIEGVDMVLGISEKFNIIEHIQRYIETNETPNWGCDIGEIKSFNPALSFDSRTRAFLKVQDGCDYSCSFCIIPMARGQSRSDSIANVLQHINKLIAVGTKEIILTGVNLGDFKTQEGLGFYDLLLAIEQHPTADLRFRISSIEPNLLTNKIIELVFRSNKIVPHFHIPLQSGNNRLLGLMRRRYRKELYRERVSYIKQMLPHCSIGVDVICGFPSESKEDFEETYSLLQELEVSYLHVFTYSERDHTRALYIKPVVPVRERRKRTQRLRLLSLAKMQHFEQSQQGKKRTVLFETQNKKGMIYGYTDNYIEVVAPFEEHLTNSYIEWQL